MNKNLLALLCIAILSTTSLSSRAEINFSGFSTLVGGRSVSDSEQTTTSTDEYTEEFALGSDSFIGLQASMAVYGDLSSTIQVISDSDSTWEMDITLSYLSYAPTDNWEISSGRQRMPLYTYSENLELSHTYHWIQAPCELYETPFESFNGFSSSYQFNIGPLNLKTKVLYGEEPDSNGEVGKSFSDIKGGLLSYNYDWLTVHAGYFEFVESSTDNGPLGTELIEGVVSSFDYSIQLDYDGWLLFAETTSYDQTGLRTDDEGVGISQPWMVSIAKQVDNITPHFTYGETRDMDFSEEDYINPFYIVGLRWDLNPSSALKFEYASEKDEDSSDINSLELALVTTF